MCCVSRVVVTADVQSRFLNIITVASKCVLSLYFNHSEC